MASWIKLAPDVWDLRRLDQDRRALLEASVGADALLAEATRTTCRNDAVASAKWEDARENPGYSRVKVLIKISRPLFDLIFNGPAGYRAQYYFAPELGEQFNRELAAALASAVRANAEVTALHEVRGDALVRSFDGPSAKVWVGHDTKEFGDAPEGELQARRWAESRSSESLGLRAPYPANPRIELIGAWFNPATSDFWVSPDKEDRALDLHLRGFV